MTTIEDEDTSHITLCGARRIETTIARDHRAHVRLLVADGDHGTVLARVLLSPRSLEHLSRRLAQLRDALLAAEEDAAAASPPPPVRVPGAPPPRHEPRLEANHAPGRPRGKVAP